MKIVGLLPNCVCKTYNWNTGFIAFVKKGMVMQG